MIHFYGGGDRASEELVLEVLALRSTGSSSTETRKIVITVSAR